MNVDPRHQQYLLALCVFLGALFVVLPLFTPWRSVYIDCDEDEGTPGCTFSRTLDVHLLSVCDERQWVAEAVLRHSSAYDSFCVGLIASGPDGHHVDREELFADYFNQADDSADGQCGMYLLYFTWICNVVAAGLVLGASVAAVR